MSHPPILLVGGSGVVGGWAAHFLREAHPEAPLIIGGRDIDRANRVADKVGNAESAEIDLSADDLGLGERPVSAVAVLFTDQRLAGLRFAQMRGIPYLNIAPAPFELGPEMAAYIARPDASAVVLGTEWMVGATSVPALSFAQEFDRIDSIVIGAVLDEEDDFGPSAEGDFARQTGVLDAGLVRQHGAFSWRSGDEARSTFRALDGTEVEAKAYAINDVLGLATALDVPNVRFDLAFGESSSRRRGERASTEILIKLEGQDKAGRPLQTRHAVIHPQGQMPLTGFGVAMLLERLTGLDGQPATPPGLYFPYKLFQPTNYLARLVKIGTVIQKLENS